MARTKKNVTQKVVENAVASAKNVDLKTELDAIASAQLEVQNRLSSLGALVTERVNRVSELDLAIDVKRQELQELFELGEDLESREAIQLEIAQLEDELVAEKVRISKDRKRDQEDYDSDFARNKKRLESELTDKREAFKKEVDLKNAELAEREKSLKDLQAQVDSIPKLVADTEKKTEAMVTNRLTKEFEHNKQVYTLEFTNKISLLDAQVRALETKVLELQANNVALSTEVVNARREANEVVKTTVEAVSGRQTVEALKDFQRNDLTIKGR